MHARGTKPGPGGATQSCPAPQPSDVGLVADAHALPIPPHPASPTIFVACALHVPVSGALPMAMPELVMQPTGRSWHPLGMRRPVAHGAAVHIPSANTET